MGTVSTVIVNFRTKELTLDASRSVLSEPETLEVVIVDNASGDDSADWLEERLSGENARIVRAPENKGFGAGNNLGALAAQGEFLFLLNSDATLAPGSLRLLLPHLPDASVGIVAPAVYIAGGEQLQTDAVGIFPTPGRILTGATKRVIEGAEPDWVSGVAMLLRREQFLDLGGFDENLFMYLEDVDLCKRYRDGGLRIIRERSAKVVHLGGGSKVSSHEQKEQFQRSTDYYLRKHGYGAASRTALAVVRSVYSRLRRL